MLSNEILEMNTSDLPHSHVATIVDDDLQRPHKMLRRVLELVEALLGGLALIGVRTQSGLEYHGEPREIHAGRLPRGIGDREEGKALRIELRAGSRFASLIDRPADRRSDSAPPVAGAERRRRRRRGESAAASALASATVGGGGRRERETARVCRGERKRERGGDEEEQEEEREGI